MAKSSENPSLASMLITDEQSKAVTSIGNLGSTTVTEMGHLARYIGRIVGTVPEDAVGFIIGDPLHAIRSITAGYYDAKVQTILRRRKVKPKPVSLSVALPLLRGAYDESREGLRDLWAALIATAMDPARADRVRVSFMDTLRHFDPLDARVLHERNLISKPSAATPTMSLQNSLGVPMDEILITVENLISLKCAATPNNIATFIVTPYGRGLLRAVED